MGKKSQPTPPQPVDPWEVARADAEFNRINQYTPLGQLEYSGDNKNIATLSFSDPVQQQFDQQVANDIKMGGLANQLLGDYNPNRIDLSEFGPIRSDIDLSNINFGGPDLSGIPSANLGTLSGYTGSLPDFAGPAAYSPSGMPIQQNVAGVGLPTFSTDAQVQNGLDFSGLQDVPVVNNDLRERVEDAYFQRSRRLLEPTFDREREALEQRLANQGLSGGSLQNNPSAAFLDQMDQFNTNRFNTMANVADQAVLAGGQESSRLLADAMAARGQQAGEITTQGQFANQAAGQQFAQDMGAYDANLGRANQLFGQNLARGQFANQAAGIDMGRTLQDFQAGMAQNQFGNQYAQQGLTNQLATTGFNNQVAQSQQMNEQALQDMFFNQALAANQAQNQASGLNLGLQQQLLTNQNAARAQGLNEATQIGTQQFNELASLLGLQQTAAPTMQNFFAPSQVDFLGAQALNAQQQQANYQAQMQNQSNMLGGLAGLGGALITGGGLAASGMGGGANLWQGIFGK